MNNYYGKSPIRVPVKLVNGHWEFFYGGAVPAKDGTIAELIIEKHSITDKSFLAALKKPSKHLMLTGPLDLMVALTIKKPLEEKLLSHLHRASELELGTNYYSIVRSHETRFFSISICDPTPEFILRHETKLSGIWLTMEGLQPKGLLVSSVKVPDFVSDEQLLSLNHAFTKLSEIYEPWRKSHTGNIYTRILYKEQNGKWYPLEVLRNAAEATEEQILIKTQWDNFIKGLV